MWLFTARWYNLSACCASEANGGWWRAALLIAIRKICSHEKQQYHPSSQPPTHRWSSSVLWSASDSVKKLKSSMLLRSGKCWIIYTPTNHAYVRIGYRDRVELIERTWPPRSPKPPHRTVPRRVNIFSSLTDWLPCHTAADADDDAVALHPCVRSY